MSMVAASPSDFNALAGMDALRDRVQRNDSEALREVAVQFDALVMNLMLKSARDATPGEGMFDGPNTQQYLELMDQQVSLALARQGGLGVAEFLARQGGLGGAEFLDDGPKSVDGVVTASQTRLDTPPDARGFVEQLLPHVRDAADSLGVDPKLLVAQAALESGWGRATLTHTNGSPAFNLFAIKAGSDWDGNTVGQQTLEFVNGVPERRFEQFRAYPDLASGMSDYVGLVKRMTEAAQPGSEGFGPENFVEALTRAGYATDPDYGNKWLAVYRGDRLHEAFDEAL